MFNISVTPEEIIQRQQQKQAEQKQAETNSARLGMTKQNILNNALASKMPNMGGQIQNTASTDGWGANSNA